MQKKQEKAKDQERLRAAQGGFVVPPTPEKKSRSQPENEVSAAARRRMAAYALPVGR